MEEELTNFSVGSSTMNYMCDLLEELLRFQGTPVG